MWILSSRMSVLCSLSSAGCLCPKWQLVSCEHPRYILCSVERATRPTPLLKTCCLSSAQRVLSRPHPGCLCTRPSLCLEGASSHGCPWPSRPTSSHGTASAEMPSPSPGPEAKPLPLFSPRTPQDLTCALAVAFPRPACSSTWCLKPGGWGTERESLETTGGLL